MTSKGLNFSRGLRPTVLGTAWAERAAGTALFAMRIYTNGFITKRWKADFWWALITYVRDFLSVVY
jgi:hypothetical protein